VIESILALTSCSDLRQVFEAADANREAFGVGTPRSQDQLGRMAGCSSASGLSRSTSSCRLRSWSTFATRGLRSPTLDGIALYSIALGRRARTVSTARILRHRLASPRRAAAWLMPERLKPALRWLLRPLGYSTEYRGRGGDASLD
jgi:hypothetical protein